MSMIVGGATVALVVRELGAMDVGAFATRLDMVLYLMGTGIIARPGTDRSGPGYKAALDEIEKRLAEVRAALAAAEAREAASRFTVYAVKEEDGATIRCEDDDPDRSTFGLYVIDDDRCTVWVSDHSTREEAEAAVPAGGVLLGDD